jgi:hypothetical protein
MLVRIEVKQYLALGVTRVRQAAQLDQGLVEDPVSCGAQRGAQCLGGIARRASHQY